MKKFSIPLQSEVQKYIKEKKNWPDAFCEHYAEKFWSHYQASGWKLSSGNAIKDWKACFNSQWQNLKFKEDIELLNKLSGKMLPGTFHQSNKQPEPVTIIEELDAFIDRYRQHPTEISFKDFGKWYSWMKGQKILKPFTQPEVDNLKEIYKNDFEKCRCAVVEMTLMGYINNGLRISDLLKMRQNLNQTI